MQPEHLQLNCKLIGSTSHSQRQLYICQMSLISSLKGKLKSSRCLEFHYGIRSKSLGGKCFSPVTGVLCTFLLGLADLHALFCVAVLKFIPSVGVLEVCRYAGRSTPMQHPSALSVPCVRGHERKRWQYCFNRELHYFCLKQDLYHILP